ncbi:hypothetical protein SteCoe_34922 [Stentor coeruleus]|uniref:Uncharacterized protein n=1 Tax=Stentor coeruleus TaxID=5963 RepID=A0A1R2ATI3_9CILI|nr:hypothetical protein SteCoe_34922 [Stentor coeruleus]
MKRPPVLRPRLSGVRLDTTQNHSLERIVQSSRNNSAEQKDRSSNIIWNVLSHKPRAHSINKENSYIETKSSRESLNYVKETLKKPIIISDAYPRTLIPVIAIRNSFYSSYDHLQNELEKYEKLKKETTSNSKY